MCIIVYAPDGNLPKKQMANCLNNNQDGWGVMWPENGNIQIVQGMTEQEFFKDYKWFKGNGAPKVFHARIKTHGKVCLDHCHPFMIPGHGALAMAHNGVISLHTTGEASDTINFINEVVAGLPEGFYKNESIIRMMSDYAGYSKLVFMDGNGHVTIVNESEGLWENKKWYSNQSFRWRRQGCTDKYRSNERCGEKMGFQQQHLSFRPVPAIAVADGFLADSQLKFGLVRKSDSIDELESQILEKAHLLPESEADKVYSILEEEYLDLNTDWDQLSEDRWVAARFQKLSQMNDDINKELLLRRFSGEQNARDCAADYFKTIVPERVYASAAEEVHEKIENIKKKLEQKHLSNDLSAHEALVGRWFKQEKT